MKKLSIVFVVLLFSVALYASAATFYGGDIYEHKEGTIIDDMYIGGGSIDVSGDVVGDAMLAGGDITVRGDVSEDLTVGGGSLQLFGNVGDDLRVAGGNVSVAGTISDDLIAFGGLVKILSDTAVGGDLVVGGGAVVLDGTVSGNARIYADELTLNGTISGNVDVGYGSKIIFGDDASIVGDLTYSSAEEIEIPEGVVLGSIDYVEPQTPVKTVSEEDVAKFFAGLAVAFTLTKFVVMLVTTILLALVFKRVSTRVGETTVETFGKHALIGFAALIATPVALVLLLMTLVGSYVAFVGGVVYMLLILLAKVFSGIVAGALLSLWVKKRIIINWKTAGLGVVVLQLLSFVPVIGWLVCFVVMLATFGTLSVIGYQKIWVNR